MIRWTESVRLFVLAARADQHTEYLRMLSSISSRLKDAPVREELLRLKDPAAVVALMD